ncbi:unnamed protein product [Danaus chrysippus]|uniref:(African queen) hypothetical protein n=1 Tax=Danaus chrysippus TaxID=151541 RepID=A0A8J2R6W5_9NEOP|nr:unnamed protein product [Danaus chrysippus]
MDNHESYLSLEALDCAKNAGVHILTLHPHTPAKLQPLDVSIYGPFKTYYNAAIDSWLLRNPGKPVTIYDLGEIIGSSFQKAMTPRNITNAFAKCGIYPFDRHIFTEEDFLPSSVTDRPCPEDLQGKGNSTPDSISILEECGLEAIVEAPESNVITQPDLNMSPPIKSPEKVALNMADDAKEISEPIFDQSAHFSGQCTSQNKSVNSPDSFNRNTPPKSAKEPSFKSPFDFRNPIKAGPRKTNRKRRKPGRSLILTDTPEKTLIEQEKNAVKRKTEAKKSKIIRTILDSDDEKESLDKVQFAESDDDDGWLESPEEDQDDNVNILTEKDLKNPLPHPPKEGEYVIIELTTKKQRSLYIGNVIKERNNELEYYASFLKRKPGTYKFHMPAKPDLSLVKENDLKYILPKPTLVGTSSRPFYNFSIDFTRLIIY